MHAPAASVHAYSRTTVKYQWKVNETVHSSCSNENGTEKVGQLILKTDAEPSFDLIKGGGAPAPGGPAFTKLDLSQDENQEARV